MRTSSNSTPLALLVALALGCSADPDADVLAADVEGLELATADDDASSAREGSDSATVDKHQRRGRRTRPRRGGGRPVEPPIVACLDILENPDGVCSRAPDDPCIRQDPDCSSRASCEAAGQVFLDGSAVPSGDSCNSCGCNDGAIICTLALCEPVFCAAFVENPDGVCSRFPLDPCISQDPDCAAAPQFCAVAGQSFPDGSDVPSGDSCNTCTCSDGSVICTLALCEPVACARFLEVPDGVCSRFPLDPCISQDPDCAPAPAAP